MDEGAAGVEGVGGREESEEEEEEVVGSERGGIPHVARFKGIGSLVCETGGVDCPDLMCCNWKCRGGEKWRRAFECAKDQTRAVNIKT